MNPEAGSSGVVRTFEVVTLPVTESTESFCERVRAQLEAMGYEPSNNVLSDDLEV